MQDTDPTLVQSRYSTLVNEGREQFRVEIYRLETDADWVLEVIDAAGTSMVWDEPFPTEEAAFAAFERTLRDEGPAAFHGDGKVVPFRPKG